MSKIRKLEDQTKELIGEGYGDKSAGLNFLTLQLCKGKIKHKFQYIVDHKYEEGLKAVDDYDHNFPLKILRGEITISPGKTQKVQLIFQHAYNYPVKGASRHILSFYATHVMGGICGSFAFHTNIDEVEAGESTLQDIKPTDRRHPGIPNAIEKYKPRGLTFKKPRIDGIPIVRRCSDEKMLLIPFTPYFKDFIHPQPAEWKSYFKNRIGKFKQTTWTEIDGKIKDLHNPNFKARSASFGLLRRPCLMLSEFVPLNWNKTAIETTKEWKSHINRNKEDLEFALLKVALAGILWNQLLNVENDFYLI